MREHSSEIYPPSAPCLHDFYEVDRRKSPRDDVPEVLLKCAHCDKHVCDTIMPDGRVLRVDMDPA